MSQWDPGAYGQVNSLQQSLAQQALSRLRIYGDERVLDVGCGDGRVTRLVLERLTGGSLLGVDPSAAMVASARERFADDPRVRFAVGTAATLPYTDEFDLIVSFNALHWEIQWRDALVRMRSALHPGGRAFLVFVCDGPRPSLEDVVAETTRTPRWREWFTGFAAPYVHVDPEEYADAARGAGFDVERVDVVDLDWDFGDPTAFRNWSAAGTVAWTSRLPAAQRSAFLEEALAAYRKVTGAASVFRFLQCRIALAAVTSPVDESRRTGGS